MFKTIETLVKSIIQETIMLILYMEYQLKAFDTCYYNFTFPANIHNKLIDITTY